MLSLSVVLNCQVFLQLFTVLTLKGERSNSHYCPYIIFWSWLIYFKLTQIETLSPEAIVYGNRALKIIWRFYSLQHSPDFLAGLWRAFRGSEGDDWVKDTIPVWKRGMRRGKGGKTEGQRRVVRRRHWVWLFVVYFVLCIDHVCYNKTGSRYIGTASVTRSGKPCLRWSLVTVEMSTSLRFHSLLGRPVTMWSYSVSWLLENVFWVKKITKW